MENGGCVQCFNKILWSEINCKNKYNRLPAHLDTCFNLSAVYWEFIYSGVFNCYFKVNSVNLTVM